VAFHRPGTPVEVEQEAATPLTALSWFFQIFSRMIVREWSLV
jgi:hypothetical protein